MATSGTFLDGRGAHGDGARHTYPGGMARSPLTLAASVTSALPRVAVVGVAPLTEGVSGRYDSAIATLDDDRRVVVRVPVNDEAQDDLLAEARALISLTAGVRGVLPFGAPDVLGQTSVDGRAALVQSLLPGYRVDAAHVPSGRGIATALAAAIAAVHDLPVTVIRDAGLPMLTSGQVRDEAERLLDRAEATGLLPFGLLRRWSTALGSDPLWRFETTVVLGGVDPASFVFEDDADGAPVVTGLLSWGGLGVGDPAIDLRWTASAPAAQADVLDEYARRSHRAPDSLLSERARLHAELEFAKWLVHGHESGDRTVVGDAVAGPLPADDLRPWSPPGADLEVALAPGPRAHLVRTLAPLFDAVWTVSAQADRVGIRLDGPGLERTDTAEIPSEGMLPGAIQVPPDGRPVILGPDGPGTGGYPVVAFVTDADRDALGQARPGTRIRFRHARTVP